MGSKVLVIAAHPDDETIFFSSVFLSRHRGNASLCCVTDGNYEDRGNDRFQQLTEACKKLGVKELKTLGYPDDFRERLPLEAVYEDLLQLLKEGGYDLVYTHSPHGEYGHIQHQDVSYVAHRAASELGIPVYCPGAFSKSYVVHELCPEDFAVKLEILSTNYREELLRFWHQLPLGPVEIFQQLEFQEAEDVYLFFRGGEEPGNLSGYSGVAGFLKR